LVEILVSLSRNISLELVTAWRTITDRFEVPFTSNKAKIIAECPLTDEDRAGWLDLLSTLCIKKLTINPMVVVTCSALKRGYRDVFRRAVDRYNEDQLNLNVEHIKVCDLQLLITLRSRTVISKYLDFLFLSMAQAKAAHLVEARLLKTVHFMPATLVRSQYDTLEIPGDKGTDCHLLDANLGLKKLRHLLWMSWRAFWLGHKLLTFNVCKVFGLSGLHIS
jgi:gluconate kinase